MDREGVGAVGKCCAYRSFDRIMHHLRRCNRDCRKMSFMLAWPGTPHQRARHIGTTDMQQRAEMPVGDEIMAWAPRQLTQVAEVGQRDCDSHGVVSCRARSTGT
jgi:hypothetical protein